MKKLLIAAWIMCIVSAAIAKLAAPSEEAKAKAAEASAKSAWAGKVDNYLLCKSQDKVAASYYKTAKTADKNAKPSAAMPPCADPGAFVYVPAVPGAVVVPVVPASPASAVKKI